MSMMSQSIADRLTDTIPHEGIVKQAHENLYLTH